MRIDVLDVQRQDAGLKSGATFKSQAQLRA